jgi:hypothetical protein
VRHPFDRRPSVEQSDVLRPHCSLHAANESTEIKGAPPEKELLGSNGHDDTNLPLFDVACPPCCNDQGADFE